MILAVWGCVAQAPDAVEQRLPPAFPPADVMVIDQGFDPDAIDDGACFALDCGAGGPTATGGAPRHGAHMVQVIRRGSPHARIVGVRVFPTQGPMRVEDLLRALDWALLAPPRVLNLSIGLAEPDGSALLWSSSAQCAADNPELARRVAALVAAGTTVVAATGDDHADGKSRAPACLPDVVAVAAAKDGLMADFANRWPGAQLGPGVDVPVDATTASGSSLAAAAVSGSLAQRR